MEYIATIDSKESANKKETNYNLREENLFSYLEKAADVPQINGLLDVYMHLDKFGKRKVLDQLPWTERSAKDLIEDITSAISSAFDKK